MSSTFPLFRLPAIAYFHVIKMMGIAEKVIFSFCSRDTHALVKHPRNKLSKLKLWLHSVFCVDVCTNNSDDYNSMESVIEAFSMDELPPNASTINISGNRGVPAIVYTDDGISNLITFWEDHVYGERVIWDYVRDLFQSDLYSVKVAYCHQDVFENLWKSQKFFERIYIEGNFIGEDEEDDDRIPSDEWEEMMGKIECNALYIDADDWEQKFQLINYRKSFELLSIKQASWITLDNLKQIDMVEFLIKDRMISNNELNLLLKHWIAGGSDRLKFFSIDVEDYDEEVVMEGIEIVRRYTDMRAYETAYGNYREFDGMEIQRVNGVKASIQYYPVINSFCFGAWPDALGNQ